MSGLLSFLKKKTNTNLYKNATRRINATHSKMTLGMKGMKRMFMGEGEMMKTYKMAKTLSDANDRQGLARLKTTLVNEMPPFHSPKYSKQLQIIGYITYLLESPKVNNTTRKQMRNTFISSLDTDHEIGRLMRNNVMDTIANSESFNNSNMDNIGSPNNYVTMGNGSVWNMRKGTQVAGRRRVLGRHRK